MHMPLLSKKYLSLSTILLASLAMTAIAAEPAQASSVRDFSQVRHNWNTDNAITKLQLYKTKHGHYTTGPHARYYFNMRITNRTNQAFRFKFTRLVADTDGGEFDGYLYKLVDRHKAVVVATHHTVTVKKAFATNQQNLVKWDFPHSENYLSYGKKMTHYLFMITPKTYYRLYQDSYHTFN